jgi:hypothetical protein
MCGSTLQVLFETSNNRLMARSGKKCVKTRPEDVVENFSIRERAVDGCAHRAEIAAVDLGRDRRERKFAIGELHARGFHRADHIPQESEPIWWPRPRDP